VSGGYQMVAITLFDAKDAKACPERIVEGAGTLILEQE
jgi:hypothetical protein